MGSTTLVTNESGQVVEEVRYEPFGDVSFSSGARDKYLYNAKEADLTGLYYYGARYYDPKFQRFTQADTKLPNIYDPQQLNRYSYVRNSPYKYVDVTGHYICDFDSECATINILRQNVYFGNLEWEEGDEALEDGKITFIHESKIESRNQWKLALWMVAADSAVNVPNTFSSGSIKQLKPKLGDNQNRLDTELNIGNANDAKRLSKIAEKAVSDTSRLQHGYDKHAKDLGFKGNSWKAERDAWKQFNKDVISKPDKIFQNTLGNDKVTGYYKKVNGMNVATYVYDEGKDSGKIATTVALSKNQMINLGLG